MLKQRVLIRAHSAGVHFGTLDEHNGKGVTLSNARRIFYWTGAFTLSEISINGVGAHSKISCSVPKIHLTDAIEIIPLSDRANEILTNYPVYQIS